VLVVATFDEDLGGEVVAKAIICLLLAFPYLLLRFAVSLGTRGARWVRLAGVLAAAMVVATPALPKLPQDSDPHPGWVLANTFGPPRLLDRSVGAHDRPALASGDGATGRAPGFPARRDAGRSHEGGGGGGGNT